LNETRNKSIDEALKEMGVKGIQSFLQEITQEKELFFVQVLGSIIQ
jgi:hypothetical protein